jgi:RHS repeat-associated protein
MLRTSLGSTSLTLNSSGSKIAELRYKAWGETRYTSGTTPTTYQFTSQRNETALGLYFYNARWYDPSLSRFTSADTLVPGGAQGYDRFSYTSNNPVRYIDPSGHKACDDYDEQGNCVTDPLGRLLDFVYGTILNDKGIVKKKYSAFDAMQRIVKKAAYIYGSDWDGFLKATNYVFLGTYSNGPLTMLAAHQTTDFHGIDFASNAGDTGFHDNFQQGGDNQVRHLWAAFATAAYRDPNVLRDDDIGGPAALYGSVYHEVIEDWRGHSDTTASDLALSLIGIVVGCDVHSGAIGSPSALPGIFDATVGVNSAGYTGPSLYWLFFTPMD